MSKWHSKNKSTKCSFKITIKKRQVYIDVRWTWIWNQYIYLGIWNDGRNKIKVLPSFLLVTRLNSQNRNETDFINEYWHIKLYMNIGVSYWQNWNLDPTKMKFFTLLNLLTRLLTSKHLKLFSKYLVLRNGAMWKRAF